MNNRLWNVKNPNQGDFPKALTVCSAGLLRSPTLAWILSQEPFNMNTRACGSSREYALVPVDEVLLAWADIIIFVNHENFEDVNNRFDLGENCPDASVIVLDIPDNFKFRDPKLVQIATDQLHQGFADLLQKS